MFGLYRYKFRFFSHDIAGHTHVGWRCNIAYYTLQQKQQQNHHQTLKNKNAS